MTSYRLSGQISTDGKLQIELPANLPPGDVEVVITIIRSEESDSAWTDEEIQNMMRVSPKTGEEIAELLDDMEPGYDHIEDSRSWVESMRRQRRVGTEW